MHADKAQLLINALRSGEYTQSKHALRSDKGFCCLGVACEIYRLHTGTGEWIRSPIGNWSFEPPQGASSSAILPTVVANWFGFETSDGSFNSGASNLPQLNDDDDNHSFSEIADVIEARISEL